MLDEDTHRFLPPLDLSPLLGRTAEVGYVKIYEGDPGGSALGESIATILNVADQLVQRGLLRPLGEDETVHPEAEFLAALTEAVHAELRSNTVSGSRMFTIRVMALKGQRAITQKPILCSCVVDDVSVHLAQQRHQGTRYDSLEQADAHAAPKGISQLHAGFALLIDTHSRTAPLVEGMIGRAVAYLERQLQTTQKQLDASVEQTAEERMENRRLRARIADLEEELARGAPPPQALDRLGNLLKDEEVKAQGKEVLGVFKQAIATFAGADSGLMQAMGAMKRLPDSLLKRLTSEDFLKKLERPEFIKDLEDAITLAAGA